MNELYFDSVEELYLRVLPALKCKKKELTMNGYGYISLQNIWNAIRELKWNNSSSLALCDIVDDILNTENKSIDLCYREKMLNKYSDSFIELPKLKD